MLPRLELSDFFGGLQQQNLAHKIKFNMSDACSESVTVAELSMMSNTDVAGLIADLSLEYAPRVGSETLRREIAKQYPAAEQDDVVVFSGAQEAIYCTMAALLKPGDEVIVLDPSYPSLSKVPMTLGAKIIKIPMRQEGRWSFNIDQIESIASSNTKLIVINQPHNPTGAVLSADQVRRLQQLSERHNIYLLCDEVALWSDYQELGLVSAFIANDLVVAVGVTSKSLGLPGIRVGWTISSDAKLNQDLVNIKSYFSSCCSRIDELVALTALRVKNKILDRNNKIISYNTSLFSDLTHNSDTVSWDPHKAGALSLIHLRENHHSRHRSVVDELIQEKGLLILPASLFGVNDPGFFRIGFGTREFEHYAPILIDYFSHQ